MTATRLTSSKALFVAIAVLLVLATEQVVEHFAQRSEIERERNDVSDSLSTLRARLEGVVNANLQLVQGLTAVIAAQPNISQAEFARIASGLVDSRHALRNIAGAPDMVISLMYPLAGNETAIGLDYLKHPTQGEAARRVMQTGKAVVAGPLPLVQGGNGIIAREPVYALDAQPGGERRFWGLVSAVLDVDALYRQAGLREVSPALRVAIRGANGTGAQGPVFYGDAQVFAASPEVKQISLPGGTWQLAAAPTAGWGHRPSLLRWSIRFLGLLTALAAGLAAYQLARGRQALANSEARLRAVLNTLPDLVWLKDTNGVYLSCNPRFEALYGASEAQIVGKTDYDFVPAELADFFRANDRAAVSAGRPRSNEEWLIFAADGHRELSETIKTPVHDTAGRLLGVLGIARDITARKQYEAALQESEMKLRLFIEHAPAALAMFDREMRYLAVSRRWLDDYHLTGDILGRSHYAVFPEIPERWKAIHRRALAGEVVRADEDPFARQDGATQWLRWEVRPWSAADGEIGGIVIFTEDISERKRIEVALQQLNAELEQRVQARTAELAAANKELETFTYSVSHDLKAPLRGIDGYSRLLLEDHLGQLDEEGRLFLANVRHGVDQMGQLIEDLLAYSRMERRDLHGVPLDLARQVAAVLSERGAEIEAKGVQVSLALAALTVHADPDGLAMVLRNLIDNALKFSRDSQPPRLGVSATQADKTVTLAIKDNGIGFDMQFQDRIFEIFQRLQRAEDYPGTGVGLAIVRKAMQRMGGRVWATSAPGQGATFYLELPR